MDDNGFLKECRQPILTAAGLLAVAAGLVLVYFGFYMLMEANNSLGPDMAKEERNILRYVSLGGIYLLANGLFNVIAGFYGAVNSGVQDCMKKCSRNAMILMFLAVLNVVILSLLTEIAGNKFNMILVIVPIVISILYFMGTLLNTRMIKRRQNELEAGDGREK